MEDRRRERTFRCRLAHVPMTYLLWIQSISCFGDSTKAKRGWRIELGLDSRQHNHHLATYRSAGLPAGWPTVEWHELNLLRKRIGGREVAVAVHEHAPNFEYRIVRGGYLHHAARSR